MPYPQDPSTPEEERHSPNKVYTSENGMKYFYDYSGKKTALSIVPMTATLQSTPYFDPMKLAAAKKDAEDSLFTTVQGSYLKPLPEEHCQRAKILGMNESDPHSNWTHIITGIGQSGDYSIRGRNFEDTAESAKAQIEAIKAKHADSNKLKTEKKNIASAAIKVAEEKLKSHLKHKNRDHSRVQAILFACIDKTWDDNYIAKKQDLIQQLAQDITSSVEQVKRYGIDRGYTLPQRSNLATKVKATLSKYCQNDAVDAKAETSSRARPTLKQ